MYVRPCRESSRWSSMSWEPSSPPQDWTHTHTYHIIEPFLVPRTKPFPSGIYCRASNTGNVGFVLVRCVVVHTHSTVWYSLHAAACNYLTTHPFSAFWCAPKNRQIDCLVTFFWDSRSTKHRKYMCLALRRSRTTVFTMFFFASGSKNYGICSVFEPVPSKNTGIYEIFSMLQDSFYMQKV